MAAAAEVTAEALAAAQREAMEQAESHQKTKSTSHTHKSHTCL